MKLYKIQKSKIDNKGRVFMLLEILKKAQK